MYAMTQAARNGRGSVVALDLVRAALRGKAAIFRKRRISVLHRWFA